MQKVDNFRAKVVIFTKKSQQVQGKIFAISKIFGKLKVELTQFLEKKLAFSTQKVAILRKKVGILRKKVGILRKKVDILSIKKWAF